MVWGVYLFAKFIAMDCWVCTCACFVSSTDSSSLLAKEVLLKELFVWAARGPFVYLHFFFLFFMLFLLINVYLFECCAEFFMIAGVHQMSPTFTDTHHRGLKDIRHDTASGTVEIGPGSSLCTVLPLAAGMGA